MDKKKDIIKTINEISGKYSPYEVFNDWIRCSALTISNSCALFHDQLWRKREDMHIETMNKYNLEERKKLVEMLGMLTETFESEFGDVLGNLFMMSGWGNKNTGQFFTPYSLSLACASLQKYSDTEILKMNEPSAGAGGMIIAVAQSMKEQGVNYQKNLRVVAQDLDWNAFYMCYIQLSLLGIDAKCVQGNTLENKSSNNFDENVFLTPMYLINGCAW